MKLSELTEQLYRRRSPEERAAEKAAPDYWRKELRKEFNAILKKHGATCIIPIKFTLPATRADFGGELNLWADGPSTLVSRKVRASGLMLALAKWAIGLSEKGYTVDATTHHGLDQTPTEKDFAVGADPKALATKLLVSTKLDRTVPFANAKSPILFQLRFIVTQPESK